MKTNHEIINKYSSNWFSQTIEIIIAQAKCGDYQVVSRYPQWTTQFTTSFTVGVSLAFSDIMITHLIVIRAQGLVWSLRLHRKEPTLYVLVTLGDIKMQTRAIAKSLSPEWDEKLTL